MNRKKLLKNSSLCEAGDLSVTHIRQNRKQYKNWVWLRPQKNFLADDYRKLFAKMHDTGIRAILPEIYNSYEACYNSKHLPHTTLWLETILPIAKSEDLEIHAWMWCMPCNIKEIQARHPEWFVVNGKGESAAVKPAYVDYYKFLCPNNDDVQLFIQQTVIELAQIEELDGIHLDYIRLPDVILADGLQPKYGIVQDREYPEYDYCYCDICRSKFKEQTRLDPLLIDDPSQNQAWRQFRYDSITNLVNEKLIPIARQYDKMITAAVFPNWQMVRQEWRKWHLDAVLPMLYHVFYNQNLDWIKLQAAKGIASLPPSVALYSGLFVETLSPDELIAAITVSIEGGAQGVSLFSAGALSEAHWQKLTAF